MKIRPSTLEAFIYDVAHGKYDDDNGGRRPEVRAEVRQMLSEVAERIKTTERVLIPSGADMILTEEDADAWIALAQRILQMVGDVPIVRRLQSGWKVTT